MQAVASLSGVARFVLALMLWSVYIGCFWLYGDGVMRNPALGLRRIHLQSTRLNKDHQARLSLLVNEEHSLVKAVRCGPYAGLGVHIMRPNHLEMLVCGGKLAGGKRFTSSGIHYDANSAPFAAHSFIFIPQPP